MKILRIGGKNLASLAGEFEVDFQQEPLSSAGLFAICGPTGAGKSTLLDTLCLALYDATPRLSKAGSKGIALPDVRDEVMTPHDSRTLLRRGAAEGYAEVDFVGNDGIAYRARWSVRRARNKADGALQPISMSLKQLPELQPLGGTNREVKSEIEHRIGLSFDQFTRAVLLAQNEFFAFLKTDDNERGELLETLTGSAIYTDISRRAFERAKAEEQLLQQLHAQLADQKPLSLEERTQLEQDSIRAGATLAALDQRKNTLDEHLRWHHTLQQLQQAEQRAQNQVTQLSEQLQTAAARKKYFALVESVQTSRPLLTEIGRIEADLAHQQNAMNDAKANLAQADLDRQQAHDMLQVAKHALLVVEQAQAEAIPVLDKAKALDAQLQALAPSHLQATHAQAEAVGAESRARNALQRTAEQRTQALQQEQAADAWLAQHHSLHALAQSWPRWDTLFQQAVQTLGERARLHELHLAVQQEEAQKKKRVSDAEAILQVSEQALTQATARLQEAQAQLSRFNSAALLERRQHLEARKALLAEAEQLWRAMEQQSTLQSEQNSQARQLEEQIAHSQSALAPLHEQIHHANAELNQAERSLKIAEAACGEHVETLRAALKNDMPCPVCGALEHPYATENTQLRAMLEALQSEILHKRELAQQLLQQQAKHTAIVATKRAQLEALALQLEASKTKLHNAMQDWSTHPIAQEGGSLDATERASWFVNHTRRIQHELQAIRDEEQAAHQASVTRDIAQQAFDKASKEHTACKEAAASIKSAYTQTSAEYAAGFEKWSATSHRLEALLGDIDNAFDNQDWQQAWHANPSLFHAKCRTDVEQWHYQNNVRVESRIQLGQIDVAHHALADALANATAEVQRTTEMLNASAVHLEELRMTRQTLFNGKSVQQVQDELSEAVEQAKLKLNAQQQALQHRDTMLARCREACDHAQQRLVELKNAADIANTKLATWLTHFNCASDNSIVWDQPVDINQLRTLLSHSTNWINQERMQLQNLEIAMQNAQTVLQERQMQRLAHERLRPTADTVDAIKAALDLLLMERQSAQTQDTALRLAIVHDDARRKRCASVLSEIEQQESSYRTWAQLSELIGSADGKKFRNYAQQFTLDILLGYANRHLMELSRRYRLERVKETLALMVIDQDMGDEMRSVHSLSGGESFLVSLALALGLASLSSNRVRVESLFIDEGFGSLDPDTLGFAMDALDKLQSLGRKVGVISHVHEMTERIGTKVVVQRTSGGASRLTIA